MLDVAWTEVFLIAVIGVMVVGPKEIPQLLYTLGRLFRRLQYVRFAMSQQFDEFMRVHDLEELRGGVNFETRSRPGDAAGTERGAGDESAGPPPDEAAADEDFLAETALPDDSSHSPVSAQAPDDRAD